MLLSLVLLAATPSFAADRAQGGSATAELAADRADLSELARLVDRWESATRRGDVLTQRATDAQILGWVEAELREADREVDKARAEAEAARVEARGRGRDDDRDLRDDRADLEREIAAADRLRSLAHALRASQAAFADGRATPGQEAHKAGLLRALQQLADHEVALAAVEVREDAGELREDRYGWSF